MKSHLNVAENARLGGSNLVALLLGMTKK